MEISAKLKAALNPEKALFSTGDRNYFADPRWETARKLANESKYAECQRLVAKIDRDFGNNY